MMNLRGMAVFLHLGLVTGSLAYVLFSRGLLYTPAATAVTLTLAEPLTAGLLGIWVLKEQVHFFSAVGIALLVGGLIVLVKRTPSAEGKEY